MNKKYLPALLFVSVCLIWGTTWLAMEFAVQMFVGTLGTGEPDVEIDEKITLVIDNTKLHFFDSDTQESIKYPIKAAEFQK